MPLGGSQDREADAAHRPDALAEAVTRECVAKVGRMVEPLACEVTTRQGLAVRAECLDDVPALEWVRFAGVAGNFATSFQKRLEGIVVGELLVLAGIEREPIADCLTVGSGCESAKDRRCLDVTLLQFCAAVRFVEWNEAVVVMTEDGAPYVPTDCERGGGPRYDADE